MKRHRDSGGKREGEEVKERGELRVPTSIGTSHQEPEI